MILNEKAEAILRHHVWASMGVSLVPIPLVDFAGLTVIQLNMLRKFSKLYGIPLVRAPDEKTLFSWVPVLASFADDAAIAVARKTVLPAVSASVAASLTKVVPGEQDRLSA